MRKKRQATHKAYKKNVKKTKKMRNQRQRKTYYVKQTVKPRKTQQTIRKAPI
mgnify:CR=1 FL=1